MPIRQLNLVKLLKKTKLNFIVLNENLFFVYSSPFFEGINDLINAAL